MTGGEYVSSFRREVRKMTPRPMNRLPCQSRDVETPEVALDFQEPVAVLWALRALTHLGDAPLLAKMGFCDFGELARQLGIEMHLKETRPGDAVCPLTLEQLRVLHRRAELSVRGLPEPMATNISRLGNLVGLNETETVVLGFATLLDSNAWFAELTDAFGPMNAARLNQTLAVMLDIETGRIQQALAPEGRLRASGLMSLYAVNGFRLKEKLDLITGLADCLVVPQQDPAAALRPFFQPAAAAKLALTDFSHIDRDLEVIVPYLRHALERRETGVNVLIHGQSGVGKTELARSLAAELNATLYEIGNASIDGHAHDGLYRIQACQFCQKVVARQPRCMVLFDEIEDVFPSPCSFSTEGNVQIGRKAWINEILEQNPVPAFWLSNRIGHIDRAYLRRFDYVLKLRPPPRSQRAAFIRKCVGQLPIYEATVERLADYDKLAPATTVRAATIARALGGAPSEIIDRAFRRTVENSLMALGVSSAGSAPTANSVPYDLSLTNADHDLAEIGEGLRHAERGRLCLYGPPGTGKTCYAAYIARCLDRPLHAKRASDILSAWIGETEKNIRDMFREAADEDAVLLLDEADSFLQDRRNARRSWEITQVNELLVHLENFDGIFVASTNLFDGIDSAALRRFDAKIHFGYLTPAQAERILDQLLKQLPSGLAMTQKLRSRLARLDNLTPGDFATVDRRTRLCPQLQDPYRLLDALETECAMKPDGRRRVIGFIN